MNDIYVTLSGNVAADPRQYPLSDGSRVTSLRLASTRRVFDRPSQTWQDAETTFFAVRCYRALADNVSQSIKLGQPIVVHGKLRIRSYERDGERRFLAEVEATSVGHDLRRGVSAFDKGRRGVPTPSFDAATRERMAFGTRDWELGTRPGETNGVTIPEARRAADDLSEADRPEVDRPEADLSRAEAPDAHPSQADRFVAGRPGGEPSEADHGGAGSDSELRPVDAGHWPDEEPGDRLVA